MQISYVNPKGRHLKVGLLAFLGASLTETIQPI